ncbi:MAG: hypothetical protein WA126_14660 [Thermodesulfovibrionales bacterium]
MKKESHFNNSDLPIIEGKMYHLGLKPEELANHILIVGDPEGFLVLHRNTSTR